MVSLPCKDKETTFFEELSALCDIDERDNRGKRHDLPIVLLGFTLALLSKRDGCLSSIHRHMQHHYAATCVFIGRCVGHVISRSQLPLVLSKVKVSVLESLIFRFYGIELSETEKQWFAGDGKDLKGSISSGDSRGVAVVQLVSHETGDVLHSHFYDGRKESEKPTIREVLEQSGALGQKISLDALHFSPQTLSLIHQSKGQYLISLKKNQKKLLAHMQQVSTYLPVQYTFKTTDKGHGRIETRHYQVFDIKKKQLDKRFKKTGLTTLIKVQRQRLTLKNQKQTNEIAFYMTNQDCQIDDIAKEYCQAIRKHWSVEVNNHKRDVSLKEDKFKSKEKSTAKTAAIIRSLVLNIVKKTKCRNIVAQLEKFQDDFNELLRWLRQIKFL